MIAKFWLRPIRLEASGGFSRVEIGKSFSRANSQPARARDVHVTDDAIQVELLDGRTVVTPLAWYPRLSHATEAERRNWNLIGQGMGIHWPDVDEDISVEDLLAGRPSGESQSSLDEWLRRRARVS